MDEVRNSSRPVYAKSIVIAVTMLLLILVVLFRCVMVGSAQPTVQTLPADGPTTDIFGTFYGINGKINLNGQDTDYAFSLFDSSGGFIRNYPQPYATLTSSSAACSSGECDVGVALWIYRSQPGYQIDLQPGTTYSFQLTARWAGGDWQYGALLSFTTMPSSQAGTMNTMMTVYTNALTAFFSSTTSAQPLGPGFDFAMSISPASASVTQGGTAQYTVGVTYSNPSFAGTMINIQLTGLGPGMNYALSQNGALTIATSSMTPTGTYPFTIIGSASGVTHQTGGTLIVIQSNSSTTSANITPSPTTSTSNSEATVTNVVTQTQIVQPSPTSTASSTTNTQTTTSDIIGLLQQNSLVIIAILVIALVAVLVNGRRRHTGPATQTRQLQTKNVTYCPQCGAQSSTTNSFCKKCGTKLGQ